MNKPWKKVGAGIVITYLAGFLILSPSSTRGAMLKSTISPEIPLASPAALSTVTAELIRLGFTPRQARDRIAWLRPSELSSSPLLLTGAGVQYPHEDVNNEWAYVLVIIIAGVAAGAAAGAAISK